MNSHASGPTAAPGRWAIALAGAVALAVAMGIGRFAFTPLLPMMLHDGVIDLHAASWLASANYLGYLAGAPLCIFQPWLDRINAPRGDPQKYAVHVNASRIDGQGAFAGEAIPARRKIGEIRGEAISVREARRRARGMARIMLVELSDKRAIDASNSPDPLRFTNHSCRPNAVLRIRQGRVEFYAMRDVPAGEELTVNYGETHHEGKLRCRCGAADCVGLI